MAPRGRSRKKKNTRMDAALEAMKSYGFSKDLILKKLKELLKVYGDENWFFIEENSYRVLLDNILEHVEQEDNLRDDRLAGPSSGVLVLPHSDAEALDTALLSGEIPESALETYVALDTALLTHKADGYDYLLLPGEGTGQKDQNVDQNGGKQQNANVIETDDKNSSTLRHIENTNLSPPPDVHPEQPRDGIPIQRRRPCYGWISSDDEVNEEDFVELEPAPLPAELAKLLFGTNVRSRRKTRWDLKPEDM